MLFLKQKGSTVVMTEKQRKLEQLVAERNRLDRLIDDLSATADFEDNETMDFVLTRSDDGKHMEYCHTIKLPSKRISISTTNNETNVVIPGTTINNYINIDASTHIDNSVKSYSDTAINTSIAMGDSAFQTISGLLSKLFD